MSQEDKKDKENKKYVPIREESAPLNDTTTSFGKNSVDLIKKKD